MLSQKVCSFFLNNEGYYTTQSYEVKYQDGGNEVRVFMFFWLCFDVLVAD